MEAYKWNGFLLKLKGLVLLGPNLSHSSGWFYFCRKQFTQKCRKFSMLEVLLKIIVRHAI
jgi:hypothetical protein